MADDRQSRSGRVGEEIDNDFSGSARAVAQVGAMHGNIHMHHRADSRGNRVWLVVGLVVTAVLAGLTAALVLARTQEKHGRTTPTATNADPPAVMISSDDLACRRVVATSLILSNDELDMHSVLWEHAHQLVGKTWSPEAMTRYETPQETVLTSPAGMRHPAMEIEVEIGSATGRRGPGEMNVLRLVVLDTGDHYVIHAVALIDCRMWRN
ncbi:hypothetical protein [Actinosynnema sp. ALI-1.44]|uniref:hypothetical protein n=1 Tax=Actinosynnema sp. ALI-1.44 TaxID=1933779 RepID=UPI001178AEB1|nr:hypothetical protein [Actinosynnema sp. ALI-1.44]